MMHSTWILNESFALQAPALAVARAVGLPIELKRLQASGLFRYLPMFFQRQVNPEWLLASSLDSLTAAPPRLLIAAGRKSVAVALAIKGISPTRVFALYVQRKHRTSLPNFDFVLTNDDRTLTNTAIFDAIYNVTSNSAESEQASVQSVTDDAEIIARVIKNAIGLKTCDA